MAELTPYSVMARRIDNTWEWSECRGGEKAEAPAGSGPRLMSDYRDSVLSMLATVARSKGITVSRSSV